MVVATVVLNTAINSHTHGLSLGYHLYDCGYSQINLWVIWL